MRPADQLAARYGSACAVLFVDLDHFKAINDTHAHEAGDTVLRSVAENCSIRCGDVVGRVGGEEFSIFLPSTDPAGALKLAETVRVAIDQLMPAIQGQADQAMYAAKRQGRNRLSVIDSPQRAA